MSLAGILFALGLLLPLSISLTPPLFFYLYRNRQMREMAVAEHLQFQGRVVPPFAIPPQMEDLFAVIATFTSSVHGERDGMEVYCCDFTVIRNQRGRSRRGSIVAVHGIVRDLKPLRSAYEFVFTAEGWTVISTIFRGSIFSNRMPVGEIVNTWDHLRSVVRSESIVPHTKMENGHEVVHTGDGIVIRPRHRVP